MFNNVKNYCLICLKYLLFYINSLTIIPDYFGTAAIETSAFILRITVLG
jgi:hypothetical protein